MQQLCSLIFCLLFSLALQAQTPTPAAKGVSYGEGARKWGAYSVERMQDRVKTKGAFEGRIKGVVTDVCKEKGCWMRLRVENGESMMVRFRDYGFFMPFDIVGHKVVLDGQAAEKEVSVKQQQHYAEDAGKTEQEIAQINQPKKEIQFIAKGVRVIK